MRARRVGQGSEFRLMQVEQEIGYVSRNAVRFHGFATRSDAAAAASLAQRALSRRRKRGARGALRTVDPSDVLLLSHDSTEFVVARSGILARLMPPSSEGPESGWGFEVELLPDEAFEVFALARARVMWRAIQATPLRGRMLQFQRGSEHPIGPS